MYCIVGNFRGRKLQICEKYDFRGENFRRLPTFAVPKDATSQILGRKLLHIATKPQNLRKFSPSKVSHYTVYHWLCESQLRVCTILQKFKVQPSPHWWSRYEGVTCEQVQFTSMQSRNRGAGGYWVQGLKFSIHTIADLATRVYKFCTLYHIWGHVVLWCGTSEQSAKIVFFTNLRKFSPSKVSSYTVSFCTQILNCVGAS